MGRKNRFMDAVEEFDIDAMLNQKTESTNLTEELASQHMQDEVAKVEEPEPIPAFTPVELPDPLPSEEVKTVVMTVGVLPRIKDVLIILSNMNHMNQKEYISMLISDEIDKPLPNPIETIDLVKLTKGRKTMSNFEVREEYIQFVEDAAEKLGMKKTDYINYLVVKKCVGTQYFDYLRQK